MSTENYVFGVIFLVYFVPVFFGRLVAVGFSPFVSLDNLSKKDGFFTAAENRSALSGFGFWPRENRLVGAYFWGHFFSIKKIAIMQLVKVFISLREMDVPLGRSQQAIKNPGYIICIRGFACHGLKGNPQALTVTLATCQLGRCLKELIEAYQGSKSPPFHLVD